MVEPASRVRDHALTDDGTSRGVALIGSRDVEINGKGALRACDLGKGETGLCKDKEWDPIMGSATVEVNGRPLVRRGDPTDHFGCGPGKLQEGSPDVEVGGEQVRREPVSIDELCKYIYDLMMKNKNDLRVDRIRLNNERAKDSITPSLFDGEVHPDLYSWYTALDQWKGLVGTGKDFDQKLDIISSYGAWCYDATSDTSIQYEAWSNIHYGFVGRAAGFDDQTLLSGAGLAQYLDHGNPSFLGRAGAYAKFLFGDTSKYDEPKDQESISIGLRLWKKYKETGSLTPDDIKAEVLKSKMGLKSASGRVC